MTLPQALATCGSMIALDFAWVLYTRGVARGNRALAVTAAALMPVLGGFVTLAVVADPFSLFPAAVGGALGTMLGLWLDR